MFSGGLVFALNIYLHLNMSLLYVFVYQMRVCVL